MSIYCYRGAHSNEKKEISIKCEMEPVTHRWKFSSQLEHVNYKSELIEFGCITVSSIDILINKVLPKKLIFEICDTSIKVIFYLDIICKDIIIEMKQEDISEMEIQFRRANARIETLEYTVRDLSSSVKKLQRERELSYTSYLTINCDAKDPDYIVRFRGDDDDEEDDFRSFCTEGKILVMLTSEIKDIQQYEAIKTYAGELYMAIRKQIIKKKDDPSSHFTRDLILKYMNKQKYRIKSCESDGDGNICVSYNTIENSSIGIYIKRIKDIDLKKDILYRAGVYEQLGDEKGWIVYYND